MTTRARWPAVGALACVAALALGGCTGSPADRPSPSVASAPVDWVTRCTEQVTYWTTTVLADPHHSYDYQEMGLSAETYDALRTVLADAGDQPRDPTWVAEHSRAACAVVAATASPGSPGDPGWP